MSSYIHPSAHISPRAKIGEGTSVWINVQIREDAVIGERCNIGKDVYIDAKVTIGNGVKIQNGVSVYQGVQVEDDVFLGPHMTFTNDLYPRAFNANWTITETVVRKGASIGAHATIVCGTEIGEYAMIASGAVVTKSVPPFALMAGVPARRIGYVCKCGKPSKIDADQVLRCGTCGFETSIPHTSEEAHD